MKVNTEKTKVMGFRKGRRLAETLNFFYDGRTVEIVNIFVYLGILLTTRGSFNEAQNILAGQSHKAMFKMKKDKTSLIYLLVID